MIAALLLAASLSPAAEKQILRSLPAAVAPQKLSVLLEVPDGRAKVVVLCGTDGKPLPLLARISRSGELEGEPVQIPVTIATCGTASASAPFTLRRKGQKVKRAVIVSFSDAGKTFLSAAITLEPDVITTSESALEVRQQKGETSFCERQRDGSWARLSWIAEAGEWSPSGTCAP